MKRILAIACILVPAAALASLNCGIIALPVEGPKVLVSNMRCLKFSVDIVDEAGKPMEGVTVTATRHALQADWLFVENDDSKPDKPVVVDKKFNYETFGNFAVDVRYSKPGYVNRSYLYGESDRIEIPVRFMGPPPTVGPTINIKKTRQSQVILKRELSTTPPR